MTGVLSVVLLFFWNLNFSACSSNFLRSWVAVTSFCFFKISVLCRRQTQKAVSVHLILFSVCSCSFVISGSRNQIPLLSHLHLKGGEKIIHVTARFQKPQMLKSVLNVLCLPPEKVQETQIFFLNVCAKLATIECNCCFYNEWLLGGIIFQMISLSAGK